MCVSFQIQITLEGLSTSHTLVRMNESVLQYIERLALHVSVNTSFSENFILLCLFYVLGFLSRALE
jgi:hypothetical protein